VARELKVSVRPEGAERVLRMLRGIVTTARRADRDIARSRGEGTRAATREAQRTEDVARRSEETKRREARRTTEDHRRQLQSRSREEQRAARAQERSARSGRSRDAARRSERSRGFGGAASEAFGALGVPTSFGGAANSLMAVMQSIVQNFERVSDALDAQAGVQDTGQRTVTAQQFELGLVRLGGEVFGGQSAEERARSLEEVKNEINAIATATNQSPGALLDALSGLQTEFSAFEFGRQNLRAMAEEAQRTGTDMATIARFAGLVNQQFGEMDTSRLLDITAQGGLQGALSPDALASNFAGGLGLYASFVDPNQTGTAEDRYRGFLATANVLRQSGLDDAQTATLMPQMFAALSREEVQRNIRRSSGVDINDFRDASGQLDMAGFVESLQSSGRFGDLETIQRAVGDQGASMALNTLVAARTRNLTDPENAADMRELMGVSAESGAAFRRTNLAEVQATAAERHRAIGVETEIEGQERMGERSDQAWFASEVGRKLEAQGGLSDALLNFGLVRQGLGALANSEVGQTVLGSEGARNSGDMSGWLATVLPQFWATDRLLGAGSQVVQQAAAQPGRGAAMALDTASQDRLAQRIGQEVARANADVPNPQNRQPGGPQSR
jgi:hypothetical protein